MNGPTKAAFRAAQALTGKQDYETAMRVDEAMGATAAFAALRTAKTALESCVLGEMGLCGVALEQVAQALKASDEL